MYHSICDIFKEETMGTIETITEEQGKQWILQKLHDQGFKFLYFNEYLNEVCASDAPPEVNGDGELWTGPNSKIEDFATLKYIIEINKPYIDIEKELGAVDWSKVPVDRPIYVRDDGDDKWNRRYFARYEDGRVFAWTIGRTSWTADGVRGWDNAALVPTGEKP